MSNLLSPRNLHARLTAPARRVLLMGAAAALAWACVALLNAYLYPRVLADALSKWTQTWALVVTLIVVWTYTELTAGLLRVAQDTQRQGREPAVVVQRVQSETDPANVHFYAHNVGQGVAHNALLLLSEDSDLLVEDADGRVTEAEPTFSVTPLGSLGRDAKLLLPDVAERRFRDEREVKFAVVAEGADADILFVTLGVHYRVSLSREFRLHQVIDPVPQWRSVIDYLGTFQMELQEALNQVRRDAIEWQTRPTSGRVRAPGYAPRP